MLNLQVDSEITQLQKELTSHRIFQRIKNRDDLATFMSWHVFAVWDFMSLVKRLQRELASTQTPWLPSANPLATRLINDIVLGEESDELPQGGFASHFDMYLMAMREIGADTCHIEGFIQQLSNQVSVEQALDELPMPDAVKAFVSNTLQVVKQDDLYQVLGNFFFGREDIIPQMFQSLLDSWELDEQEAPMFVYYLKRHIELDTESHGPAALRMIQELTAEDPQALNRLKRSAIKAIRARIDLWDALAQTLSTQQSSQLGKAS